VKIVKGFFNAALGRIEAASAFIFALAAGVD